MVDCVPFFEPGQDPTLHASAAVEGCRFVSIITGVNAVDDNAQCAHTGAGLKAFGVAARTKAIGEKVMAYRHGVVPVLAGAALAHGQGVESDAQGRAIPLAAGVRCGTVMADAANATMAKIALELGA